MHRFINFCCRESELDKIRHHAAYSYGLHIKTRVGNKTVLVFYYTSYLEYVRLTEAKTCDDMKILDSNSQSAMCTGQGHGKVM